MENVPVNAILLHCAMWIRHGNDQIEKTPFPLTLVHMKMLYSKAENVQQDRDSMEVCIKFISMVPLSIDMCATSDVCVHVCMYSRCV